MYSRCLKKFLMNSKADNAKMRIKDIASPLILYNQITVNKTLKTTNYEYVNVEKFDTMLWDIAASRYSMRSRVLCASLSKIYPDMIEM